MTPEEDGLSGEPQSNRGSASEVVRLLISRARRELFFWTARQVIGLTLMIAFTTYAIVSLFSGEPTFIERLVEALTGTI